MGKVPCQNLFFARKKTIFAGNSDSYLLRKTTKSMSFDQLDFTTYCIGNLAARLSLPQTTVYNRLRESGILSYITEAYDVLHTLDKESIMDDLIDYMKEKGVA